ncbi:MAG: hypothetical protein HY744_25945 [Deltaproteobacteria bacterium]|nr:hypothetical protein [Deltaproteobacteria bacterium]
MTRVARRPAIAYACHKGDLARVVVVGPSHHSGFAGFSIADVDASRTR